MEKVSLTSTGVSETPSGLQAVAMYYRIADDGIMARFSFKVNVLHESIHVRWPANTDIALVPSDTGAALVANNYGRYLDVFEVETYNGLIDAMVPVIETSTSPETPVVPDDGIVLPSPIESQVEASGDGGNPVPPEVVQPAPVVFALVTPPEAASPTTQATEPTAQETASPAPAAAVPAPNWGAPPSAPTPPAKGKK